LSPSDFARRVPLLQRLATWFADVRRLDLRESTTPQTLTETHPLARGTALAPEMLGPCNAASLWKNHAKATSATASR
jgi:hypothetical protein